MDLNYIMGITTYTYLETMSNINKAKIASNEQYSIQLNSGCYKVKFCLSTEIRFLAGHTLDILLYNLGVHSYAFQQ